MLPNYCHQKEQVGMRGLPFSEFCGMEFRQQKFFKVQMSEFGTRFHIFRYRNFFLMSDLSSPDESPYRKTLMFKFSAHSDVSVINGDRFILQTVLMYNDAPLFSCFYLFLYFDQSACNQSNIFTMNYSHQDLHTGKISDQNSNFHFFHVPEGEYGDILQHIRKKPPSQYKAAKTMKYFSNVYLFTNTNIMHFVNVQKQFIPKREFRCPPICQNLGTLCDSY